MSHRCSFCGHSETPERKLIAGAEAFICSECVRVASNAVAELELEPKVRCAICHEVGAPEHHLVFEGQGYLCKKCVRAVRAATDAQVK